MIDVQVTIAVEAPSLQPAARFWIDADAGEALGTEVEVRMQRSGTHCFRGSFPRELLEGRAIFLYRLALLAPPAGQWALTIRDRATGRPLLDDGDDVVLTKTWLTGTCSLLSDAGVASRSPRQAVGDPWRTTVPSPMPSNVVRLASFRRR